MKAALISNVNITPVNRLLKGMQDFDIYDSQGYGNELGVLLNRESPLYDFQPEAVFIVIDVMEIICHNFVFEEAETKINEWFALFKNAIKDNILYFISDAYLYGFEMEIVWNKGFKPRVEAAWLSNLQKLTEEYSNIRSLSYSRLIQRIGEANAFSPKMWYMGKVLHSAAFHKALAEEIKHRAKVEKRQPKKVLLLDLDNTLWRGLAGEHDNTPIILSDDGVGLAYKNFQRSIRQLRMQGVVLGIVSKNNEKDAMGIIANHPHMVLREDDFAVTRINWENKADSIVQIAHELNVGLDSIVFIDDNRAEQALVREALEEVAVPDFPERPEELTAFISGIYRDYFEKSVITGEDREKTNQYRANKERKKLLDLSVDFDGYLDSLDMKLYRVNPKKNKERFAQLMNKTNQFNLTARRFSGQEISKIIGSNDTEVFLYRVADKFGDNGIVIAAIVEFGREAIITEFTMSCRVMGRRIEDAVIEDMENAARARSYRELIGVYKPTDKNKPVQNLYSSFGYKERKVYDDGTAEYAVSLGGSLARNYHLARVNEEG